MDWIVLVYGLTYLYKYKLLVSFLRKLTNLLKILQQFIFFCFSFKSSAVAPSCTVTVFRKGPELHTSRISNRRIGPRMAVRILIFPRLGWVFSHLLDSSRLSADLTGEQLVYFVSSTVLGKEYGIPFSHKLLVISHQKVRFSLARVALMIYA